MRIKFAELDRIDHNEPITPATHPEFLCTLHRALLLALQERGRLSPMEYIRAEERLLKQFPGL